MSQNPHDTTSPPILLRIRNNAAQVAYIFFLPLDRPDLFWSPAPSPTAALPTSPPSHSSFRSVATGFRPRNLDLSQIRVEPATIEIGSCPIDHPDVRHIAYHRGKALAIVENRVWFSHKGSERRQVYAEHYYSTSNVELIEEHVRVTRSTSAGAVESCEKNEDDKWVTDDEEQRTAAIVASITANILQETESESECESEAEIGKITRDPGPGGRPEREEQARLGVAFPTVSEPSKNCFSDKDARAALPTLDRATPPLPIARSKFKPQRPRRATTSQRTTPAPESPASPRKPGSFWKHLRRQRGPLATSLPSESLRHRFLTFARETTTIRKETRPSENTRLTPMPPPGPEPESLFPHPNQIRRESKETLNSFAFVVDAAKDPEFFRKRTLH